MPDVILLDINMPQMNGYEFLEEYSRLPIAGKSEPHIYVLSTVTRDMPEIVIRMTKGQFEKPLSNEHIKTIFLHLKPESDISE